MLIQHPYLFLKITLQGISQLLKVVQQQVYILRYCFFQQLRNTLKGDFQEKVRVLNEHTASLVEKSNS